MTGLYPGRTNVTDWIPGHQRPKAQLSPPDWTMRLEHRHTTLAEALGAAGYRTAHVGKWHLMPRLDPDAMSDYLPDRHGFEINVAGNEWGAPGSYYHPYERNGRRVYPLPDGGADGDYLTDRLTDEALSILEDFRDEPFLLYFPYYTVHTPIQAKPEDLARFDARVDPEARHRDPAYAGMLAALDRSVGRIRERLGELGIADRTVIVFTGDNGGLDRRGSDGRMGNPTENEPLRAGKGSAYEGGVRTPTIYYWPGATPSGVESDVPVITVDVYPTVLDIAGVEGDASHNASVDGVSLTGLLRDPQSGLDRETLYWHYPHYHNGGATPHSAIRDGDWRLVHFYEDGRKELYNLGRGRRRGAGPGGGVAGKGAGTAREAGRLALRGRRAGARPQPRRGMRGRAGRQREWTRTWSRRIAARFSAPTCTMSMASSVWSISTTVWTPSAP